MCIPMFQSCLPLIKQGEFFQNRRNLNFWPITFTSVKEWKLVCPPVITAGFGLSDYNFFPTQNVSTEFENTFLKLCTRYHFHQVPQPWGDRPAIFLSHVTISPWEKFKPSLNMWPLGQRGWLTLFCCDVYLRTNVKPKNNNNSVKTMPSQTKQLSAARQLYGSSYLDL